MDNMGKELNDSLRQLNLNMSLAAMNLERYSVSDSTRNYNHADYTYEIIMKRIKEFEDGLDNEHEVGVMLAAFGQSVTMSVTEIGYSNPSTLVFYGYVNGQSATLVQHLSQLNFLLLAIPKAEPEKPPRRIGFVPSDDSPTEG